MLYVIIMLLKCLLLGLIVISSQRVVSGWVEQLANVAFPVDLIKVTWKAWKFLDEYSAIPLPLVNKRERELLDRMNLINGKIDEIGDRLDVQRMQTTSNIIKSLSDRVHYELQSNDLIDYITRINTAYSRFKHYTQAIAADKNDTINRVTLQDFATSTVSHKSDSVWSLMERITAVLVPYDDVKSEQTSILIELNEQYTESMGCKESQSTQQAIYSLYNTITMTELKAYTMIQFSYMLLKTYNMGNFTEEANIMKNEYEKRSNRTQKAVIEVLKIASREYRKCDPDKPKAGETYLQITNLLQGYIQNEVDLNPEKSCGEDCGFYTYTKSYSCFKDQYCKKQRTCSGKILNCRFIDSDMWVCPGMTNTSRRYEYIEYENGITFGQKPEDGCSTGTTKVDSWWRWLFWHCSYCMCLCDETGMHSDRYINMRSVMSDMKSNMVVTGLRFAKENRIIHLQIQQGVLTPHGRVDPETVHWKPVENYTITDKKIYNEQDYHTLSWEKRGVDLDDIHVKPGELITGVRFKMVGANLNLEVLVTPFDLITGQLMEPFGKSRWQDNIVHQNGKIFRREVQIPKPDLPTRATEQSKVASLPGQFVQFTHTDFKADAAQTTVPFLDSQDVAPSTSMPLTGVGLYYRTVRGYGGYLAPRIFNMDLIEMFMNQISDSSERLPTVM